MLDFLLKHEAVLRTSVFLGTLAAMALWELRAPRRALVASKSQRWLANLGIVVLDSLIVRWTMPLLPVSLALICAERGWGVMNILALPIWLEFVLSVVVLDFVVYLQHVMFHAVPGLWRLHMVHHSDMDLDVTSGNRFHPIEILLSVVIKLAAVMVLGPSAAAVVAFEMILNGMAQFNHSNVIIPARVERLLRLFVVTPDMHKVHHSIEPNETNSNFGFNLPWWDRLLGTYRAAPRTPIPQMTIGLSQFRDPQALTLGRLLLLPITGSRGRYAINARFGKKGEEKTQD
jgi:sterol desaturase/sphingolipid hydroxylase (fatty acid hydroxylase superfamily)